MTRTLSAIVLISLLAIADAEGQDGSRVRTTMFHGLELPYEVVDGQAVYAGDIILGTAEEAAAHAPSGGRPRPLDVPRVSQLAPVPPELLWPGGIIPYVIDDDVPHPEWILEAMRVWNEQTVVEFVDRTTERDYLRFAVRETGGCSAVSGRGWDGGERIMPIGPTGCSVPITLHELGHAIGMGHENQRRDRDQYLRLFGENIHPARGNWRKSWFNVADIGPYDYRSVMHYGFSSDDLRRHGHILMADTIPPGMPMGQTVELSPGDIDSVARLYGHVPAKHVVSTNPAGLEIIVDGVRLTAPASFDWEPGSEHTLEVPSPQYRDGARFLFGRWSDDGSRAHTVTVSPDTTLFQASFIAQYQIAASVSPPGAGTVAIRPAADADGFHTLRTPIELIATPVPHSPYRFLNWEVRMDYWWGWIPRRSFGEASNPARTFAKAGLAARAHFVDGPIFRIDSNIEAVPVIVRGRERMAPVAFPAASLPGPTTIAAKPIQASRRSYRHRFRGWSNGGEATHSVEVPPTSDSTLTLTLDTDYHLTTRPPPNGDGKITITPFSDDGFYPEGTAVRLLGTGVPPWKFIGWNGDVSGWDPATVVVMDDGKLAEAVAGRPSHEIQSGVPVDVSLRWTGSDLDFRQHYVRVPSAAQEVEIRFDTRTATPGAEAGLFVSTQGDLWPGGVRHELADRILRDGVATIRTSRPRDRWPAAYFLLIRAAESESSQTQTLEGTLVVTVTEAANRAPLAVGKLADRTLNLRDGVLTIGVGRAFTDPDGDALTYEAKSSVPAVAAVATSGSTLTVTPVAPGSATVTVAATDRAGSNETATQTFDVTVNAPANRPPELVGTLPPLVIGVDEAPASVEVAGAFRDPDGDTLTYAATSSAPGVAAVAVAGSRVTVTPVAPGSATVTVAATDRAGSNETATQMFDVTVGQPFTDDPIVRGVTPVRTVHFRELRTRIDALRSAAGLGRFTWTDAVLRAGETPVRLVHLRELRSALAAAYAAAGRPVPGWTDASPVAGSTPIRAVHLMELRSAVTALERGG